MKTYKQTQIDIDSQINLLKSEGLAFKDEQRAKHLLANISFFRIKSYLRPLRQTENKDFKAGATFEDAYTLYKFDSELRKLVASELEKIEVSIRTQLSFCLTDAFGAFWFLEKNNFKDIAKFTYTQNNIKHELSRSDDDEILNFANNYDNPFPPSWMTMEVTSFGSLSMLYKLLNSGRAKRNVAKFYGLSDTAFESWLHCLVYIRNICAHHGRLWNRTLRIQPITPKTTKHPFQALSEEKSKLFYSLSIIIYFLRTINPSTTFATRFKVLLSRYPNVDTAAMGFPTDWDKEPLWQ